MLSKLLRYRVFKDKTVRVIMFSLTGLSLLILVAMGVGLYLKSTTLLASQSVWDLLTNSEWRPMAGKFGFLSFIAGSACVTLLAVAIALPISLLSALYIMENAQSWVKKVVFPMLDILAGIPPVVYGLWGTLIIVPWIADKLGPHFVDYTNGYTVLAGGIVLAVMVIPLLVSLFMEIFSTVSKDFKDASASLGATRWQTSRLVVLRKSLPGVIAAVVLAISRAFGETLAVVMVCGNVINIPKSLFESCYPLPALIANNYGEMLSLPMYESALMFAALILFVLIFIFNAVSRIVLQHVEKKFML